MDVNAALLSSHLKVTQQLYNACGSLIFVYIIQAFDPLPVFQGDFPGNGVGIFLWHAHVPFLRLWMSMEGGRCASGSSVGKNP